MEYLSMILLMDIFITVKGWQCVSPVRQVYRKVNTDAALRFSANLNNIVQVRQFNVLFHDGSSKAWIRYSSNKSFTSDSQNGIMITGDIHGNVSVTLEKVQMSSAGIYAMSNAGISTNCNCLYILGTPTKPSIAVNKVPSVGENSTLTCSSTSTTTPSNHSLSLTSNWRVDNIENPNGPRFSYSINRNTLTLSSIVKKDANKQFTCTATEDVSDGYISISSDSFSLDVHYGPDTTNINVQSPYPVTEGDTNVNIECFSDCYPRCSYRWTNLTSSSHISSNGVLSLPLVNRYMAGDYKCTSSNSAAQYTKSSEKTITLVVKHAPDVNAQLSSPHIREGEDLQLYCNGTGVPSNYIYSSLTQTWNNIEIPNSNKALSGTPLYSSIHFSSLKLEDTGTYTCTLNNGVKNTSGYLNQVGSRSILVEVRPKVLTDQLRFTGSTGGTAKIQIPLYSYPKLKTVTMKRYDGKLISSEKYKITENVVMTTFYGESVSLNGTSVDLVLKDLKEDDFGNYTLMLKNTLGTTSVNALVIEEGRPLPPKVFQFLSRYSIPTFLWQKNFNGGPDQSFVIQTSVAGIGQWTNHTNIHESDKQHRINSTFFKANISGLRPGVYMARIFANNTKGESETVDLGKTFEVVKQEADATTLVPVGAIVGGIVSSVVAVFIVGVVLVMLSRRARNRDTIRNKPDTKNCQEEDEEDEVNTVNPMYAPAEGPTDNTYAQPMKRKKPSGTSDVYAGVDKNTKQEKTDTNIAKSAPHNFLKNDIGKGSLNDENLYENPLPNASKDSKKLVNKDGLIYADLALNDQPEGGQKNLVIGKLDSMTEYVEVDFTKKAEPLPDSDEEDKGNQT